MKRMGFFVIFLSMVLVGAMAQEFYVSPLGDDSHPGTREKPFKSITRARDAVREINQTMTSDIVIHLAPGPYAVSKAIVFAPEDSATNNHTIIYAAQQPHKTIVTGGVTVGTWDIYDAEKNIYRANVGKAPFRQLYIDDIPGIRARTPNRESTDDRSPYWECIVPEIPKMRITPDQWNAVSRVPETKRREVELVMICHWYHQRVRIGTVAVADDTVDLMPAAPKGKFHKPLRFYQNNPIKNPFYFENALAFVDADYEWYHDVDDGALYLALPKGKTPKDIRVTIPVAETLISVKGNAEAPIRNIEFRGIVFECTNWAAPSYTGVNMTQGAQEMGGGGQPPGALVGHHVRQLAVRNCVIRNLGANGIVLDDADETDIEGNQLYQIAANGVSIDRGSGRNPVASKQSINVAVWNNHARACGNHYSNGDFLFAGNVKGLIVEHNLIHDMPYSGMQIGQQPGGMKDVGCGENRIRFNHIHHCNLIHGDGGAIYTLGGIQKGTVIAANYIHDVTQSKWDRYKVSQIYLDNYSSQITVQDNVINGGSAEQRNKADHNVFKNNVQSNPVVEKAAGINPGYTPRSR